MSKPMTKPKSMQPSRLPEPAPKAASPVDIMNALGAAAHKKAQPQPEPDDESDPANSMSPGAKKSPADPKSKQVAAMKEQEKHKGKPVPASNKKMGY